MIATRTDHYTRVTTSIVADLERGVRPWLKPWIAEHSAGRINRPLRSNGQPYKGINVLSLWESAISQHFTAPIWMTFKQAKELGADIRKGSQGTPVVYADSFIKTETTENGQETQRGIYFLKGYTVFNVEQIDGLPSHYYAPSADPLDTATRIEQADRFFNQTQAEIRHGGDRAFYSPASDFVQMPPYIAFRDAESYYATLAHEVTHWTRHPSRLDRSFGQSCFGDEGYAREELVAEIGSAFLCCDLGIIPEPRQDHAAYLDHWLKVLKADKRAIFRAAAHAQRAVDFLHGLQRTKDYGPEEQS